MERLVGPPPHWGWRIYLALLGLLTAMGFAYIRFDILELVNMGATLVGLAGLFGYAWSLKTPYDPAIWKVTGWALAALIPINLAVMLVAMNRPGSTAPLWTSFAAIGFVIALSAPLPIALFRYARRLSADG